MKRAAPYALLWLIVLRMLTEFGYVRMLLQFKVVMTAALLVMLLANAKDVPRHRILGAQLLFFAWCVVGIAAADQRFDAYLVAKKMYAHTTVAFALAWIISDMKRFRTALWSWLLIMAYVAWHVIRHKRQGPGGSVADPNETATALACAFAVGLFGFERLAGWRKWLSGGLTALFASSIIFTFSRGGFVGLAVAAFYCFLSSNRRLFSAFVAVIAVLAVLVFAPAGFVDEMGTIGETEQGTAKTRQFLWMTSFNMWKAHPIMGVGGGGFNYKVMDYIPMDMEVRDSKQADHYYQHNWWGKTVHSMYFQLLPEQGLVGMSIWAFLLISHFTTLTRLRRDICDNADAPPGLKQEAEQYCGALRGAMVGYLAGGAFVSVGYYPFVWLLTGFAVGLDRALRGELAAAVGRPRTRG